MTRLQDIHNWPEIDIKSKHYICKYQIDNELPLPLSGHKSITSAHYSNGNLARCWKALGGTAKEIGENNYNCGIWCLYIEDQVIKLTVDYFDPQETPLIPIDSASIKGESGCSERSKELLDFLLRNQIRRATLSDLTTDTEEILVDDDSTPEPDTPLTPQVRRIRTQSADPTIHDLHDRYKVGDLALDPDYQRHFVWDRTKSSRLIESVLLDVPLPIVYLAEEQDGREEVIDGQQRLTSFFQFLDGDLALTGLEMRADLNGKRFATLDRELQRKLQRATLRTVTIKNDSSEDLKFEIFKRLNTGSVALNDQELRNCVYAGAYNKLLRELAADPDFRFLLGISKPETRMRDVELVLRFAAFSHSTYLNYRQPMKRFLNEEMHTYRHISPPQADALRNAFKNSVQCIRSLLGTSAFKRYRRGNESNPNGYWDKQFNSSLFDILMWGFTQYPRSQVFPHLDAIQEALIWLMTEDQEFIDSIELSTSNKTAVTTRFDKWRAVLQRTIGLAHTEPRCFTRTLKEELFQADPTCAICGSRIQDVDDAAVDHIEQYWAGGRTIPENARLTHRFCNWSRPRHDRAETGA